VSFLVALIPVALLLLGVAVLAFAWAVRSGQFEDIESAPLDILADDESPTGKPDAD
jgi:cbb3-type cytochrome oxidase maturation protein